MSKRGAVTIYVAIAILIVAIGIFVASVVPKFRKPKVVEEAWFKDYVESCIKQWLEGFVATVSICQPGSQASYPLCYNGIPFFCYNDRPGEDCAPTNIVADISGFIGLIEGNATMCIQNATQKMQERGYEVDWNGKVDATYAATVKLIKVVIDANITLKKGETAISYKRFEAGTKNKGNVVWQNYEEFQSMVEEIVKNESEGDPQPQDIVKAVMAKGYSITIDAGPPGCWITIYTLTNTTSHTSFMFAIREVGIPSLCSM
jgi:hypothetical protein